MKQIGIKLSDGSFLPIMADDNKDQKSLVLKTTVDNQDTLTADFYRSDFGAIDEAQYINSLQVTNIPHENAGSRDIYINVDLSDDGNLNFSVSDSADRSAKQENTLVIERGEDQRKSADFAVSDLRDKVTGLGLLAKAITHKERRTVPHAVWAGPAENNTNSATATDVTKDSEVQLNDSTEKPIDENLDSDFSAPEVGSPDDFEVPNLDDDSDPLKDVPEVDDSTLDNVLGSLPQDEGIADSEDSSSGFDTLSPKEDQESAGESIQPPLAEEEAPIEEPEVPADSEDATVESAEPQENSEEAAGEEDSNGGFDTLSPKEEQESAGESTQPPIAEDEELIEEPQPPLAEYEAPIEEPVPNDVADEVATNGEEVTPNGEETPIEEPQVPEGSADTTEEMAESAESTQEPPIEEPRVPEGNEDKTVESADSADSAQEAPSEDEQGVEKAEVAANDDFEIPDLNDDTTDSIEESEVPNEETPSEEDSNSGVEALSPKEEQKNAVESTQPPIAEEDTPIEEPVPNDVADEVATNGEEVAPSEEETPIDAPESLDEGVTDGTQDAIGSAQVSDDDFDLPDLDDSISDAVESGEEAPSEENSNGGFDTLSPQEDQESTGESTQPPIVEAGAADSTIDAAADDFDIPELPDDSTIEPPEAIDADDDATISGDEMQDSAKNTAGSETESASDTTDTGIPAGTVSSSDIGKNEVVAETDSPLDDDLDLPDLPDDDISDFDASSGESAGSDFDLAEPDDSNTLDNISNISNNATEGSTMSNNMQDSSTSGSGTLDFGGLYDEDKMDTKEKHHTSRVPLVICIICALICIAGAALVLLVLPSQYNLLGKRAEPVALNTIEETKQTPIPLNEEETAAPDSTSGESADTTLDATFNEGNVPLENDTLSDEALEKSNELAATGNSAISDNSSTKENSAKSQDQNATPEEQLPKQEEPSDTSALTQKTPQDSAPVSDKATSAAESLSAEQSDDISAKSEEIVVVTQPSLVKKVAPVEVEPSPKAKDVLYTIKWGDTLWDIAASYYKNPWKYHMIAERNNIEDPDYIISGTEILLPKE